MFDVWPSVKDYLPLQQGLRLVPTHINGIIAIEVKDYLPLQQGLRLPYSMGSKKCD